MDEFEKLMNSTPDPVIPFGKHRGKYASDIDVYYLDWLNRSRLVKSRP